MKVIGIGIKPTVIFDMCSYYSLNRVFMQDNPNNTHIVNNAFALTEDDRKFFFYDEYDKACAELSILTLPLRRGLILTEGEGTLPTGFKSSFITDRTVFYYKVADKFAFDIYLPFMADFLKMTILKNWYELKNKYSEVEVIAYKLEDIKKKIKTVVYNYDKDDDAIIPYNNGFSNPYIVPKEEKPPITIDIINVGIFTDEFTEEFI